MLTRCILILSTLALSSTIFASDEVCLTIDVRDTGNKNFPNHATEVKYVSNSFSVYHEKEACFQLDREYYMQYFLWQRGRTTVYGTRCRYVPSIEDEGMVLQYKGMSGGTKCPIVEKIGMDNIVPEDLD
jgi:hypothetical protein